MVWKPGKKIEFGILPGLEAWAETKDSPNHHE